MSDAARRAVFLDRDGTIIEDADYLTEPGQIRILPGVLDALRRLREAGFLLVVVTNQSAIARGWLTEEGLALIHAELNRLLAAEGAAVDAYYHCPHLPAGGAAGEAQACDCRKPAAGLFLRAGQERGIDMARSYAVGDAERDVEAGRRAGCNTILIGGGRSAHAQEHADDLAGAADIILAAEDA